MADGGTGGGGGKPEHGLRWFGPEAWSLHAREHPELRVDIPVGSPCVYCGEPIEAGGSGVIMTGCAAPHHEECFVRTVIGGVRHQLRKCTCYGNGGAPCEGSDSPGMTAREEAKLAVKMFTEGREHWTARDWFAAAEEA